MEAYGILQNFCSASWHRFREYVGMDDKRPIMSHVHFIVLDFDWLIS